MIDDPWSTKEEDFPKTGTPQEKLKFLLRYAVLAPSGHNTQPWFFKLDAEHVKLFADRARSLPVADPEIRELVISCGAALGNLRLALRYFGYSGHIETFPDKDNSDCLARISLGAKHEPSSQDRELFSAILKRRTNRREYEDRSLPDALVDGCRKAAEDVGAGVKIIADSEVRRKLAELTVEGDREQCGNPQYRCELAQWTHSRHAAHRDGLGMYAMGMPRALEFLTPFLAFVLRKFDLANMLTKKDRDMVERAPLLAVLTTSGDTAQDWLTAGQALMALLLTLTNGGGTASYFNQSIQVPRLRTRLKEAIDTSGYPQVLFRLGFGPNIDPAVRRPISEVVELS